MPTYTGKRPRRLLCPHLTICLAALLLMLAPAAALAQGPITPRHSASTWQVSYWNNTDLAGPAALQREELEIDNDWANGSPDASIATNGFSARWTRYFDTAGGAYRFTATGDDGIRVAVDGRWIIDQWSDHAAQTFTADANLAAGHHLFTVEYYENGGRAVARFAWGPVGSTVVNWRGEYFDNRLLQGAPALVRDDANLSFDWGSRSPAPGVIDADGFSARWTRTLSLAPGMYRFSMTVDDGGRLWVNNHLLVDVWQDQAARTYTGDIYLPGGNIPVRMEYYENAGGAVAKLAWSGANQPPPPPPPPPTSGEVTVDDVEAGFVKGGVATSWRGVAAGYADHLIWTRNNDRVRPDYNWARWYPHLAAGRYEVLVYIPQQYGTTRSALCYWISHAGSFTQRIVDQAAHAGQWVSLGTYQFNGTNADYLSLSDVTYERYLSRSIAFDAARWVPR